MSSVHADRHPRAWVPPAAALLVFVLLAVVHTWPLATNPAHLSRNDNGDTLLNTWVIAWVAHQLPRAPLHLFDANIFFPERHTLGYSEAMIVQSVLAMPVLAAGASPVLAYNLVLLAGFALTGWAFWLLILRWTGSLSAAYVAGSLAAFNAHVLVRLPHLQTQHVEFIALVVFALDGLLVSRRVGYAFLLAAAFALQGLTSVYLLVFTTWLLIFAVGARARDWLPYKSWRGVALLAVAGLTASILLAPYVLPYLEIHRQGFERSVEEARRFAGSWENYLSTGSRMHYALWSQPFTDESVSAAFPGVTALVLVALGFSWPETRRDPRFRMCVAAGVGCALVAVSPLAPFFPLLHRYILLLRAIRVEAHLDQIVLLMIAITAGFGMAGLLRRLSSRSAQMAVAVVAVALVNLEALRAPLGYEPFSEIPHVYEALAGDNNAVIAELPLARPSAFHLNATYMLNSTVHWRPMVNGYSGFRPQSYDELYDRIQGFPDMSSIMALKERGVTDVVVHKDQLPPECIDAISHWGSLNLRVEDGDIQIYELR